VVSFGSYVRVGLASGGINRLLRTYEGRVGVEEATENKFPFSVLAGERKSRIIEISRLKSLNEEQRCRGESR
jgi:hypothetical protein